MKLIAIVGGIGSGKSVVSHVLRLMDYEVYDCDICAKKLMNESETIKQRLAAAFGATVSTSSSFSAKLPSRRSNSFSKAPAALGAGLRISDNTLMATPFRALIFVYCRAETGVCLLSQKRLTH